MVNCKLFSFVFFVCFFQIIYGQQNQSVLNGNSISALLYDEGRFFHDFPHNGWGYKIAGEITPLIYSGGLWFGGTNQTGDLKLASQLYGIHREFYRGPFSTTGQYMDTAYVYAYESGIWTVEKSDIIYHIDNYNQPGYTAPEAILNWPGNGNPSIGVAVQLAPFVDVNNNGVYEPYEGDYPCIKGDVAAYQIMHEDREHMSSGGEKIGIEIHLMAYQIQASNYIDSTTFIDVMVINRGENLYEDFKTTFYLDPDIGFPEDDYIGSAPDKNLIYAYNGLPYDPGQGTPILNSITALGIVSLNKEVEYSGLFFRDDMAPSTDYGSPSSPEDFWNYMNGKWRDGTEWTNGNGGYGGGTPIQHFFDGNPYLGTGWTELDADGNGTSNQVGDRRFFITSKGEQFYPGDTLVYNYAIILNQQGDHLENVQGLLNYADSIQQYFDNQIFTCSQQGTGIADVFEEVQENLNVYFEITRLDGEGNMGRAVELHPETEQEILTQNSLNEIRYARGRGPIEARLTDTINHSLGHFVLKFDEYSDVNTATWTVYHYDTIGGNLLETFHSSSAINIGDEQHIPQWGMAIRIEQENYSCPSDSPTCAERDKKTRPIEANLTFEDENNSWLTGIKNTNENMPLNWIMSGFTNNSPSSPDDFIHDLSCYNSDSYDIYNVYSKLADGIVAPSRMVRYNDCQFAPLVISDQVGSNGVLNNLMNLYLSTIYQPSIDLVFTNDTSKWTRSPVIELNTFDQGSISGGKAGFLRQSPSVDKQGNSDGTGVGMSWFPGYAIDVETGRRLNIAFGENSTLLADNGGDMMWNPTDRIFDENGNYVLGGQHVIYVFGREENGMDNYDAGEFIRQQLEEETSIGYRNVYSNVSWVMQPLLKSGAELNSSDAKLKVRINKEFKTRTLSNQNEGRPMFSWDVVPYEEVSLSIEQEKSEGKLVIYPNPATNQVKIVWEGLEVEKIALLSYQGNVIQEVSVNNAKGEVEMNVSHLASGVYFIRLGKEVQKLVIQ